MRPLILALAFLAGCTFIDNHTPPPAGWPSLRVEIVEDTYGEKGINYYCGPSNPIVWRIGCAVPNFLAGVCHVYVRDLDNKELIEHERKHCAGYDHPGGDSIRRIMDYWQTQGWKPQ